MRSGIGMVGNREVWPGEWGDGDWVTGEIMPLRVVECVCIISMCEEV